jgi:hypothetical protein
MMDARVLMALPMLPSPILTLYLDSNPPKREVKDGPLA